MSNNDTSQIFDTVVVAATAPVAQFIDFESRLNFSFNASSSLTDLPIREVYYPSTNSNQTDGRTIIASYTFTQDSLVWQALSELDAIEFTLKQLIKLHKSSSNMREYFQGGKVKHWLL